MRQVRPLVVLALASVVVALAPAAHASFPGGNGMLAYRGERPGDTTYRIYVRDGATETAVTPDGAYAYTPDWSPKTGRVLYLRAASLTSGFDLWTVNPDGTDPRRVTFTPNQVESDAIYSPTGGKIAWTDYGTRRIYVMRADGSRRRLVADLRGEGSDLSWSPDGKWFATQAYRKGSYDLLLIRVADGAKRWVDSTTRNEWQPDWSPDGTRLVFSRDMGTQDDLFSIRTDGTGQRRLTRTADISESGPVWSPNGKKIAFVHLVIAGNVRNLAIMPATGGFPSTIYDAPGDDFDIAWQAT